MAVFLGYKVCVRGCLHLLVVLLLFIIYHCKVLDFGGMPDILSVKHVQVVLGHLGMAAFVLVIDLVQLGNLI